MSEQPKICPLLSAGRPDIENCARERCALWHQSWQLCALLVVARPESRP